MDLTANVAALEEFLTDKPNATIVLAHVGRDTNGDLSAALIDRLVTDHPNLVIQLHPVYGPLGSPNAIVDQDGSLRGDWLPVLEAHSDRVVMGSDAFFIGTDADHDLLSHNRDFLQQLPEALAHKIGCTNPVSIYKLPRGS